MRDQQRAGGHVVVTCEHGCRSPSEREQLEHAAAARFGCEITLTNPSALLLEPKLLDRVAKSLQSIDACALIRAADDERDLAVAEVREMLGHAVSAEPIGNGDRRGELASVELRDANERHAN